MMGRKKSFFRPDSSIPQNLFIGGVSSIITTPLLLANRFNFLSTDVSDFEIVGADIMAKINVVFYALNNSAFGNEPLLTYFRETANKLLGVTASCFYLDMNLTEFVAEGVNNIGNHGFRSTGVTSLSLILVTLLAQRTCRDASSLTFADFSGVISITSVENFRGTTSLEYLNLESCISIGDPATNNNNFLLINPTCVIHVNVVLATNNGGSPDADVQYAIDRGCDVIFVP